MTILKRGYRFLRYNDHKWLSVQCWIYSAIYRLQVLYGNTTRLRVKWGSEGEESPEEETIEHYRYAKKVAYCVNRVCSRTSWESKWSGAGTYCAEIIEKQRDFFYNVSGM